MFVPKAQNGSLWENYPVFFNLGPYVIITHIRDTFQPRKMALGLITTSSLFLLLFSSLICKNPVAGIWMSRLSLFISWTIWKDVQSPAAWPEPWPPWLKDIKLRMKPLVFTAALVRGYFPVRRTLLLLCLYTEQKYIFSAYWVLIPWIEIQELLISARKCAQKAYFSYFFVQIHIYSQLWDLKLTA